MADGGKATLERLPERARPSFEKRRDLWVEAGLDDLLEGQSPQAFMLRFTISHPGMTTTIVGTMNPKHLADNVAAASQGPLPADVIAETKRRLDAVGTAAA